LDMEDIERCLSKIALKPISPDGCNWSGLEWRGGRERARAQLSECAGRVLVTSTEIRFAALGVMPDACTLHSLLQCLAVVSVVAVMTLQIHN
jgi:hypothetical protein